MKTWETSRTSRTVEVNYETEEVKDETLNEGKRVVETKGQKDLIQKLQLFMVMVVLP